MASAKKPKKTAKKASKTVKKVKVEKKTPEETTEETQEEESQEQTIGDIVEEEGLVTEPDRESMLGKDAAPDISELLMRIDRIDGKLDLFKGMLDSFGERISDMNERLGDTRRMVFDREKWASKLETEFEKVSSIVKELDPEKIVLKFEKFKTGIDTQDARVSRLDELQNNANERMKLVEEKLVNIKSLDNIMKAAELVDKKIKEIEDTKNYSDKLAAKVESMFLEINDKVSYLKDNVSKLQKVDSLTNDATKEIESIKFQIDQELVKRKDADELIDSVKDIIVEEIVGINPAAFDSLRHRVTLMENKDKSSKSLENEMGKYSGLMDKVERDFQMGRLKDQSYGEIKKSTEKKIAEIKYVLELRSNKPNKAPQKLKEKLIRTVKEDQKRNK
ncbi:MAG: hypothetical protein GOU98_04105 [Candidatus Altiarchaeota archaeon]|nr:hypothetical protein [Candidatus Altiarchaeota archaeon]